MFWDIIPGILIVAYLIWAWRESNLSFIGLVALILAFYFLAALARGLG